MDITIVGLPNDIDEKKFVEFALIFVERHLRVKKQIEIGDASQLIKTDFDQIKALNGL